MTQADQTKQEEVEADNQELIRDLKKGTQVGKYVLWGLLALSLIGTILVIRYAFFPAPPAEYLRAQIETPRVAPTGESVYQRGTGNVRVRAWIASPLDPKCMVSTQYYVEFSDGTLAKLPGMRITTQGDIKEALFETAIPVGSPEGPALFYASDIYNCGVQTLRVISPKAQFTIDPTKEKEAYE